MTPVEAVGIDLGGTKMALGVLSGESEIAWESREPSTGLSEDELVEMLIREVTEAREKRPGVEAVGMGIPATIDRERGAAVSAVNLPITDLPLRDVCEERLSLPVSVDNDANVAALAEQLFGAAKGAEDAVMLTIGTGIGGGLILGGEVYRGSSGAAAELGHIPIDIDGPPCQGNCPGNGCLETLASGTALGREARALAERKPDSALGRRLAAGEEVDGRAATEAAQAGDADAIELFAEVGRRLGAGMAGLANIFDPEVIVVGGGVLAAGDLLLEPARAELRRRALPPMNRVPVVPAKLGPEAGMIGAAAMARIELERNRG